MRVWLVIWLGAMVFGFGMWYVFDDAYYAGDQSRYLPRKYTSAERRDEVVLMQVGGGRITLGDVDFEHELLQLVLADDAPLLDKDPLSLAEPPSWHSLRQFILQTLVKRKALFAMIQKDQSFDLKDPEIYRQCYRKIQVQVAGLPEFFKREGYQDKLENRICEAHVIDQYVEQMTADVVISEAMARQYYQAHQAEFTSPERILVRHIHLPSEGAARRILRRAHKHNFKVLAQQHSIAPEAEAGGLLGPFAAHEMPTFLREVFTLKLGRISSILKSSYGYHIVLPLKKYPARLATYEEVAAEIKTHLQQEQKKQIYEAWLHRTLNAVAIVTATYLREGGSI